MNVHERLRKLQEAHGFSDYKLAKKTGLSPGTISNIFKRNTVPNIDTLEAICKGYGLTLGQFFAEDNYIELTPEAKELFEYWSLLPSETKKILVQLIKSMCSD